MAEVVPVTGADGTTVATASMSSATARRFVLADAMDRAWRTFKSGVGIDIAVGLALAIAPLVSGLEWTTTYWIILGTAAAKSVVQAIVSYILRRKSAPRVGLQVK